MNFEKSSLKHYEYYKRKFYADSESVAKVAKKFLLRSYYKRWNYVFFHLLALYAKVLGPNF